MSTTISLEQQLADLQAENARLKARHTPKASMKVSEKGGLSIYGLGRFPVTLYREQWTKLLAMSEQIQAFIVANSDSLKSKEV